MKRKKKKLLKLILKASYSICFIQHICQFSQRKQIRKRGTDEGGEKKLCLNVFKDTKKKKYILVLAFKHSAKRRKKISFNVN